jgi:hypothetical protein
MELRIYGASDDLVEFDGAISGEESVSSNDTWSGYLHHKDSGQSLTVHAAYILTGTWVVGVAPYDEDTPLPDWPIRIEPAAKSEPSYSSVLVIDVPEGTEALNIDGRPVS